MAAATLLADALAAAEHPVTRLRIRPDALSAVLAEVGIVLDLEEIEDLEGGTLWGVPLEVVPDSPVPWELEGSNDRGRA